MGNNDIAALFGLRVHSHGEMHGTIHAIRISSKPVAGEVAVWGAFL